MYYGNQINFHLRAAERQERQNQAYLQRSKDYEAMRNKAKELAARRKAEAEAKKAEEEKLAEQESVEVE